MNSADIGSTTLRSKRVDAYLCHVLQTQCHPEPPRSRGEGPYVAPTLHVSSERSTVPHGMCVMALTRNRSRRSFHVAIEPRSPATRPIRSLIVVHSRTAPQKTEENVPRWCDHNTHVPAPHHQIPWLRPRHSLKTLNPSIKIRGTCIRVGEARSFVNRMHQM